MGRLDEWVKVHACYRIENSPRGKKRSRGTMRWEVTVAWTAVVAVGGERSGWKQDAFCTSNF